MYVNHIYRGISQPAMFDYQVDLVICKNHDKIQSSLLAFGAQVFTSK